jgi:hypothetical protein
MLSGTQYGPAVNTTYPLGHYIEDYDYLGDLGYAQGVFTGGLYDLNEYNMRYCVTPEYPGGTYAYFLTIGSDGLPAYPFNTGRRFYGSPTGGSVTSIAETVITQFRGGPNKTETVNPPSVNAANGNVTLTWSAVEGGTYKVETTPDLTTWTAITPSTLAVSDTAQIIESGTALTQSKRFYRISRTSLATFDSNGFNYTAPPSFSTTAKRGTINIVSPLSK